MLSPSPDLAAVKRSQQAMWSRGDFAVIATRNDVVASRLVDVLDPVAGSHVLDVAGGTGNAALAAARTGCRATGTDYVPELVRRGRERAAAERLDVTFEEADAEALPYADGAFDAVLSVFGVMFAPDQERAAAELLRVCRPGGLIGLACWTPEGFFGDWFRLTAKHVPPPPGLASPLRWGTADGIAELLGDAVEPVGAVRRTSPFRYVDAAAMVGHFRTFYGPTITAFAAAGEAGAAALERDLVALVAGACRRRGPAIAVDAEYLEIVARRR
jgi:SAM-dependent methyltransferase